MKRDRARQGSSRLRKSAQVDEQIFQEGLAISLDNEKRLSDSTQQTTENPPSASVSPSAVTDDTRMINEFHSMIDGMLPSARKERAACLAHEDKRSGSRKKKKKEAGKRRNKKGNRKRKGSR